MKNIPSESPSVDLLFYSTMFSSEAFLVAVRQAYHSWLSAFTLLTDITRIVWLRNDYLSQPICRWH